jgi:hypothetical protein
MTKEEQLKHLKLAAQRKEWCELADTIITIEQILQHPEIIKDDKRLELFKLKLEVWEAEKASRLEKQFNSEHFINKNHDYYDGETF